MPSFFFPCTTLIPDFPEDTVNFGQFSFHKRLWQTTIFDLATLQTKHKLHMPMHLMEVFLNHSNLEIEVRADSVEEAGERARLLQVMIYLQDTCTFLMPFVTTHSLNSYSGINSRDSDLLSKNLSAGMKEGITSDGSQVVEAWNHEMSLWCMPSFGDRKVTADVFEAAERDVRTWEILENKFKNLPISRLSLQTAPIIQHPGSSLLHIWQGIESIFQVSTEVTFRVSLMLAQLTSVILDPDATYKLAKKSYSVRSKAAHGSLASIGQSEWSDAWHLLTLCLKAIVVRGKLPTQDDLISELLAKPKQV